MIFNLDDVPSQVLNIPEVDLGSAAQGAKAIFQNWGLRKDVGGQFLQRRLDLWFEIQPPQLDVMTHGMPPSMHTALPCRLPQVQLPRSLETPEGHALPALSASSRGSTSKHPSCVATSSLRCSCAGRVR